MRGFGPERGRMVNKGFGTSEGRAKRAEIINKRAERKENREGIMNREDNSTHGIEDQHGREQRK